MYYFVIKERNNAKTKYLEARKFNSEEEAWAWRDKQEAKDDEGTYTYYISKSITFGEQVALF